MSRHIVMDSSGHSTFEFNPRLLADLADAERRFNQLVAKGYVPAELKGDGTHRVPPKKIAGSIPALKRQSSSRH